MVAWCLLFGLGNVKGGTMKHIKALTQDRIPAVAGPEPEPPTLQECLSYLLRTGDLSGFKECFGEKKGAAE